MEFKSKYGLGELVYLVTDTEQLERMVTGVKFNLNGLVYTLQCGVNESYHYEAEISKDKDILKRLDVWNN
jgi:hypothetical protein